MKSSGPQDPNWVSSTGNMDAERLLRHNEKVAELRKTNTIIDWSGVNIFVGPDRRRIALWLSEVDDD
jgi:hypothetical protein